MVNGRSIGMEDDWRALRAMHPEWFEELFRWLKDKNDGSYHVVTWGMRNRAFRIEREFLVHIGKQHLVSWLYDWYLTKDCLGVEDSFIRKISDDWLENCMRK